MHSYLWNSISTNLCRYYDKQFEGDKKLVSENNIYIYIYKIGGGASNWLETALHECHFICDSHFDFTSVSWCCFNWRLK